MSNIVVVSESIFMDFEEVQVVCVHKILENTRDGWKLLCFLSEQELKDGYMEVPSNQAGSTCPNCNNYHANHNQQIHSSFILSKPMAVMGMARDEIVGELREELEKSSNAVNAQKKFLDELAKKIEGLETDIKSHQDLEDLQDRQIRELEEKMKGKRKLEEHLDRARKLVGSRDWDKKVIGEEE